MATRRWFRPPMVGDQSPEPASMPSPLEPDVNPGPAPAGVTQAEWNAYSHEAVLAWR
jgi:hypothetical protein